jgi:hypothetical protein
MSAHDHRYERELVEEGWPVCNDETFCLWEEYELFNRLWPKMRRQGEAAMWKALGIPHKVRK